MSAATRNFEERLRQVLVAWRTLRPDKSFSGMAVDQFEQRLQPSFDARAGLNRLKAEMAAAQDNRVKADRESLRVLNLVVNAVKGDPEEGEDSQLYEAFGYVRKSDRRSGLIRRRKGTEPIAPPPVSVAA